jgi:hypothetical protein
MNRENYKKDRNKPKINRKIGKAKSQMLAKQKRLNAVSSPKLCVVYSTKTEWLTNVIPKLKEK